MATYKTAIIQFPGSNCERETCASAQSEGLDAEILRWNCTEAQFHSFDAYILPGGFSFQDRVRAGVIASKLEVVRWLQEANKQAKPILGICNGCQILAEAGLVPDQKGEQQIEMALAPNMAEDQRIGFICDWVYVSIQNPQQSIFTKKFDETNYLPIPINHGEGCFIFSESFSADKTVAMFQYCDRHGNPVSTFPENPNGSTNNVAGISNSAGNVFAMMPHPERATFLKQIPEWIHNEWSQKKKGHNTDYAEQGPWALLFRSLFEHLSEGGQ